MMLLLLFGSFFLLLALGVPILFSMGVSAGVYYVVSGYPLMQFVQKTIGGVDSFTLLAIPFFLLAGDIMGKGGISKRMLRFANALVGPLTGGLAVTGVVSSAMFGTICGSAPATAARRRSLSRPNSAPWRSESCTIRSPASPSGSRAEAKVKSSAWMLRFSHRAKRTSAASRRGQIFRFLPRFAMLSFPSDEPIRAEYSMITI